MLCAEARGGEERTCQQYKALGREFLSTAECMRFQRARADAAEKRVGELEGERDRLSEIMRGWTWHEGRIEGPSQKVANGAYVLESIRLAAFREVGDILALRAHEAREEKA